MRAVELVAHDDEYDSSLGWIIKGTALADDLMADREGALIAHDLLEHMNGQREIGSVWDELEAIGAVWQVRGRHGDVCESRRFHPPERHAASDVSRMFEQWTCEAYDGPGSPMLGTRPSEYDADFLAILQRARYSIPLEFNDPVPDAADVEAYLCAALRRMRIGFRKATHKYGMDYYARTQWCAVRDAVRAQRAEFEGQRARLLYGKGEARVLLLEDY